MRGRQPATRGPDRPGTLGGISASLATEGAEPEHRRRPGNPTFRASNRSSDRPNGRAEGTGHGVTGRQPDVPRVEPVVGPTEWTRGRDGSGRDGPRTGAELRVHDEPLGRAADRVAREDRERPARVL